MSDPDVETDLLAAVYNDPGADAPRLVYMDWLIERGDPRGELIALQMARHRSESGELRPKEARQEARLLEEHLDRWLGEVARYVSWLRPGLPRFSRGFLDAAAIDTPRPLDPEIAAHPVFSTVTELHGECRAILRPALRVLRKVDTRNSVEAAVSMLPEWVERFLENESIQELRFYHSVLVRRSGQCVLRVNANDLLGRSGQNWLDVLARLPCPGWVLEVVSRSADGQDRGRYRDVAAQLSARLPGFQHVFLADEPEL